MEKVLFYKPKGKPQTNTNMKRFTRSECIAMTLKKEPKTLEQLIKESTEIYESQFDKKEGVTWETYRIYKILYPALIVLGVKIPENLKPEL